MIDDYMLNKVLDKIKEIASIKKMMILRFCLLSLTYFEKCCYINDMCY